MATSKRRGRKKGASSAAPRSYSELYRGASGSAAGSEQADPTAVDARPATGPAPDDVDWVEEYSYVRKDLRQLAAVSLSLFALMLVIGFLL